MFAQITPRYDLLNHLLSLNLDRGWRRKLIRRGLALAPRRILDLACGSGDLAIGFRRRSGDPLVVGADFCLPMLDQARAKARRSGFEIPLLAADALSLPFPDGTFDLVTVAFGLRNFSDFQRGLSEAKRVLAPGATLLALEFSMALGPCMAALYRPYFRHVLPRVGRWISGSDAYVYLNRSVERFCSPSDCCRQLGEAGFSDVGFERLAAGAVILYAARAT